MGEQDSAYGIRILSLDGGGPGCFSQLVILDEIMGRIAYDKQLDKKQMKPADYFDLIGGAGLGAAAIKELHSLGSKLRMNESDVLTPKERLEVLKGEITEMLQRQGISMDVGLQDERALLVARTTASSSCQWLSTYSSRQSQVECSVVDALSATIALPTLFDPVSIGPEYAALELNGANLAFNNPTRELLNEAQRVYGDERQVSVILSLGSGKSKELSIDEYSRTNAIENLLKKLVMSSEATERDLAHQLYDVGAYVRLNVEYIYTDIQLHEWNQLSVILARTQDYLASPSVTRMVDSSIVGVIEKQRAMTLNQL
ncbi:7734_t:CDS:2, partial [Acaulospora colombiana]